MLSEKCKWIITTGVIFWCLTVVLAFNIIVTWETYKYAFAEQNFLYLSSPAWFILIYVAATRVMKLSPRFKLILVLSLMSLFFALAWFKTIEEGVANADYLLNILCFTLIFSTIFTIVIILVSLRIYRSKRRTADEYISEVMQ